MKKYQDGLIYAYIHFIIEIVSFYIIVSYLGTESAFMLALGYDILAFVPQGIFGYVIDEGIRINYLLVGVILSAFSLLMMHFNASAYLVMVSIALGNAVIHVSGAERTLRYSEGKMSNPALFVSGGSFGLITGKLLASSHFPVIGIFIILLTILIPMIYLQKHEIADLQLPSFDYASSRFNWKIIVGLAVIVVAVRAFMGYGIPTSWKKTVFQSVLLYCFMGCGKAAGGILIDRIGIRKTAMISTIGALPFLVWGDTNMYLSLIGIMLFSMTMAVTLAIIVSKMQSHPGVAFGMTTIGLFLGTFPLFCFRIHSKMINIILIIVLTIASVIILNLITKEREKDA